MEKNVGNLDKGVRVIIALLIAFAGYKYGIWWLYLVALLPLCVAILGYCPPYKWFGINTSKK